jgi:hypothetical protein
MLGQITTAPIAERPGDGSTTWTLSPAFAKTPSLPFDPATGDQRRGTIRQRQPSDLMRVEMDLRDGDFQVVTR